MLNVECRILDVDVNVDVEVGYGMWNGLWM
jgi:hypothetical protein